MCDGIKGTDWQKILEGKPKMEQNIKNCPNCGAPIISKTCSYCGTTLINYIDEDEELRRLQYILK